MIYFFIGTTAQLIKMAPLLDEVRNRGIPYRYIDSGQHPEGSAKLLGLFGLPEPHVWLNRGANLATVRSLFWWFGKLVLRCLFHPSWIRRELFPEPGICLIHGDTVTTLLGALFARRIGIPVAHVEAGLRSRSYFHPFPEEIIRVMCMHLSNVLFAPSDEAEGNLRAMRVRGKVIHAGANTILDTIRMAGRVKHTVDIPNVPYVLVSCHRFELIYNKARTAWLLGAIELMAEDMMVVFSVHAPTEKRLRKYGYWERLQGMRNLRLLPPQNYVDFLALERRAEFVAADGGSIQEETFYIGIPCLVMRQRTERGEGLNSTAMLSEFSVDRVSEFLKTYRQRRGRPEAFAGLHPSSRILDAAVEYVKK